MSLRTAVRARTVEAPPRDPQRRVVVLVGLAVAGFLLFLPARQLIAEKVRIARLEHRLEALSAENRALESEVDRLRDPEELELVARERFGLVKPGEQAYVLVPQPTPVPPADAPEDGGGLLGRVWDRIVRLVRGRG